MKILYHFAKTSSVVMKDSQVEKLLCYPKRYILLKTVTEGVAVPNDVADKIRKKKIR